jgi:hypothetical protein
MASTEGAIEWPAAINADVDRAKIVVESAYFIVNLLFGAGAEPREHQKPRTPIV